MLSIADSPCPRKILAFGSDEKGHSTPSETPTSSAPDPAGGPDDPQHRRFSIRDFVLSCRSKDIGNNWPFPQQCLRFCLKHGVLDFLPPFEPPDLVRARLSGDCEAADDLVVLPSEIEGTRTELPNPGAILPAKESVRGSSEPDKPSSEEKSAVIQAVTCKDELLPSEETGHGCAGSALINPICRVPSVQETSAVSESSSVKEAVGAPSLTDKTVSLLEPCAKKCRLIVRFCGSSASHGTEKVSSFTSVADSMASKVCPVCKTFSSSSNTTLNAHIDQCLSSGASAKGDAVNGSQHKVKPRKKRSMEEIYATAARSTLQDLDKRNGTNWELELASMSHNYVASHSGESQDTKISPPRTGDTECEGAIYVDSNGTKLLILSKFNDARPTAAVGCSGAAKCVEKLKNKGPRFGKKRRFHSKYKKYLQAKIQIKQMGSTRRVKEGVHKNSKHQMDIHHEDKSIHHASDATEEFKVDNPGNLGHWICSKRSSIIKHLNGESSHRSQRNKFAMGYHVPRKSDLSSSCGDYSKDRPIQRSYDSHGEIAFCLKTQSNMFEEQRSADLLEENARSVRSISLTSKATTLRRFKSKAKCVSSTKYKSSVICACARTMSTQLRCLGKATVYHDPLIHKGQKVSRRHLLTDEPQCAMGTGKCNKMMPKMVSRKLLKRHFVDRLDKAVGNSSHAATDGSHDSHSAHGLSSTSSCVRSGLPQSNFSGNVVRADITISDTLDDILPCKQDIFDSNKAAMHDHAFKEGEDHTLCNSQLGDDCCHDEVTKYDAQVEPPNIDVVTNHPLAKILGTTSYEGVNSEDLIYESLDSSFSPRQQQESGGADKVTDVPSPPELPSYDGIYAGATASGVSLQEIHRLSQTEFGVNDTFSSELQNMECRADVASALSPIIYSKKPENNVAELQNSSSVNTCRTGTAVVHNLTREPSGSPISATSTITHFSENLKSRDVEQESSEEPVVRLEKMRPDTMELGFVVDDNIRWKTTTVAEKITPDTRELETFCDNQTCCAWVKDTYCKSRFLKRSSTSEMMPNLNINQVASCLHVRPGVSSSGTCSHSTYEVRTVPILDPHAHYKHAMSFPAFSNFRSAGPLLHVQSQTTSSPILRLMGKNLMVMNKEKPVQQQAQVVSTFSERTSNGKYMCLPGFSSTRGLSNLNSFKYHSQEGHPLVGRQSSKFQVPVATEQVGHHSGTLSQTPWMETDYHDHSRRSEKKLYSSSSIYGLEQGCIIHKQKPLPVSRAPHLERNIIVLDDSPEREFEPSGSPWSAGSNIAPPFFGSDFRRVRPTFCYPSQNMFQWVDPGSSWKSSSTACPARDTCPTKWVSTSVSPDAAPPIHFAAPSRSASQQAMTMYHSTHLR